MYICLCNALTDRRLKDAVSQEANRKCGGCVRRLRLPREMRQLRAGR